MNKRLKKICVLLAVLAITIGVPLRSAKAAGLPVIDIVQKILSGSELGTQIVNTANSTMQVLKTFGLDQLAYTTAQAISKKLVTKILNQVNGGASGNQNSLFIKNFGAYFNNLGTQQVSAYTKVLNASGNPFAKSISQGISNQVAALSNPNDTSQGLNSFSLSKVLPSGVTWQTASTNIGAAGNQGWDFYSQLALPQNTPLGSAMIAQDQLAKNITSSQNNAKTQLTSSGFTPTTDSNGNIKTPAGINSQLAGLATSETFTRLDNANTFGKLISASLQQLASNLIAKGLSKLDPDGGAAQNPYGDPYDVSTVVNSGGSWASVPDQIVDFRNDLDSSTEQTALEIQYLQETVDSVKKPVSDGTVLALEECVPGPDTGWESRLNDYVDQQTKATQGRANDTGDKGAKNTNALADIQSDVSQAISEEEILAGNPYLNIPGASAMQTTLSNFYQTAFTFQGLIDIIITKEQLLDSLQVLSSQVVAEGTQANNGTPLMLLDSQWNAMTQAQKDALYANLTPSIVANYPQYTTDAADVATLAVTAGPTTTLSPLPSVLTDGEWNAMTQAQKDALYASLTSNIYQDFPQYDDTSSGTGELTPVSGDSDEETRVVQEQALERDATMKQRIFDEQWNQWETLVPDAQKQDLYAQYVSLSRTISDPGTVESEKAAANAADAMISQLGDTLSDCQAIRAHLISTPNPVANDTAFISTLKSEAVRSTYAGPSILTASQNNIDFSTLNQRLVGGTGSGFGSQLQVSSLAADVKSVLQQDGDGELFCRLMTYEQVYWEPQDLTGYPISCSSPQVPIPGLGEPSNWYHTNNGDILYSLTNPAGS